MLIRLQKKQEFKTKAGVITTDMVNLPTGFNTTLLPTDINQLYNTGIPSDILDKHIKNIMSNCDIIIEKELREVSLTGKKLQNTFSFGSNGMGVKIEVHFKRTQDNYKQKLNLLTLSRDYVASLTLKEDNSIHVEQIKDRPRGRKRKV